ncbi:WD repeat containing protein [Parasponia andersonii]|uniref:WD repeat containing protein n=1 Tax=Parasponia andersonii TaxID=3476 RepID=A0A2P5BQS1_PARAD|nr:WD repeat containing protein [Parasponia andersonii]
MFAKRLLQKAVHNSQNLKQGNLTETDLDLRISVHYGIPSTSSLLAFDPIQRLLAIGTLDGRIKVIGGDGIEGIFISPKQLPYKNIEFLQNQGYLVSILNDNDIQIWNLERRCLVCCLHWESSITAFTAIHGSNFMYVGDEYGSMSVVKFNVEEESLLRLPYHVSANTISEAAEFPFTSDQPVVGVLPQPRSSGNRVLIAYQNGLVALWDIIEARIIFFGGGKDLQLKDEVVEASGEANVNSLEDSSKQYLEEKEISALCWASSSGSILAVGYVDGDILFWNTSSSASSKGQQALLSSNNVVKLRLSSAERRLPVIVLQWSATNKSRNDCDGQLFIYGGDEIGSEEVLTVLTLEWSSGTETLICVGRTDLTLSGSFADMVLVPSAGAIGSNKKADVLVLTSPGELHLYDDASLSSLTSQQERKPSVSAVEFPAVIPASDPTITVAKLIKLPPGENSLEILLEITSLMRSGSTSSSADGAKWPLTGGVPSQLSTTSNIKTERVYLAGYSDGSLRIWDATLPVLSFACGLEGQVQAIKVAGSSAPVSELDFCCLTLSLALGNECGLVRVYNLKGFPDGTNFHFVTDTKHEVHSLSQEKGLQCSAVFSLTNSPVQTLCFVHSGAKLAVGYKCGRLAVIDMSSLSVAFFLNDVSCSNSPVISISWKELANSHSLAKSPKNSETNTSLHSAKEVMFILRKDAKINVVDGINGNMICPRPWNLKKESIAISMYVIGKYCFLLQQKDNFQSLAAIIFHKTLRNFCVTEGNVSSSKISNEKQPEECLKDTAIKEPASDGSPVGITSLAIDHNSLSDPQMYSGESVLDSLVLLCCEDSSRLYSTKSVIQGNKKSICKVKHAKPCIWTTIFKKDESFKGLVLLFETGAIEIRSLPDLELVKESSLMSILRWNFKANMNKMMSSSDNGLITLANGCEVAFISVLASENDFRIPEFLPCLHDQVLAAAADAAFSHSINQKKKQVNAPGILGGIVKGLKIGKADHSPDSVKTAKSTFNQLELIFLKASHSSSSLSVDHQEAVELNIDDIEIDEPLPIASTSTEDLKNVKKEKGSERERLFKGGTDDVKPRVRTPQEIMAAYGKARDASSVAANARNKLVERQDKLERINKRTEELQSGAEDFASMANELVKTLEKRRWWQI